MPPSSQQVLGGTMNQVTKILKTNNYHLLRMTPKYSGAHFLLQLLNLTDNLISLLLTHLLIFYSKVMTASPQSLHWLESQQLFLVSEHCH